MENDFSFIELLMIRKLVKKNNVKEIAPLMEKPLEDIQSYIVKNNLNVSSKKKYVRKPNKEKIERERRQAEKEARMKQQQINELERKMRRRLPEFKTREVDYSKLITVKIDHKTFLQVPPDTDVEKLKKKYLQRVRDSKTEGIHYKEIKKFKPLK